MKLDRLPKLQLATVIAAMLALVAIYWPALHGPFLLDDFAWLPNLAYTSPSPTSLSFWNFALSGLFTMGRILPMATFALQAEAWPAHPEQFKAVNLVIHGLNAILLLLVVRHLARLLHVETAPRVAWFAVAAALIWGFSPSHVGAVVYVIQRMNLMAASFSLLTVLAYLHARSALLQGNTRALIGWAACGLLFLILGILSKENAAVAALVISAIELTLDGPERTSHRWLRRLVLAAPLFAFAAFFALKWSWIEGGFATRTFSMSERLLLAPQILFTYVQNFFFPRPYDLSLFQDDFSPQTPILATFLAAGAWIALVLVLTRLKSPLARVAAIGVLWFLAAHALEAGPLALELYFPHRNYFPSAGLAIAAAALLYAGLRSGNRHIRQFVTPVIAVVILGGMVSLAVAESVSWADKSRLIKQWYSAHPSSDRATEAYGTVAFEEGNVRLMLEVYRRRQAARPDDVLTVLENAMLSCVIDPSAKVENPHDWNNMRYDHVVPTGAMLIVLTDLLGRGDCKPYSADQLESLAKRLLNTEGFGKIYHTIWQAQATLALQNDEPAVAAYYVDRIAQATNVPSHFVYSAELLMHAQGADAAIRYLKRNKEPFALTPKDILRNVLIDKKLADIRDKKRAPVKDQRPESTARTEKSDGKTTTGQ